MVFKNEWEDYYEILGVNPDASEKEIKDCYRYKANILHPDHTAGMAEQYRKKAEDDLKKVNLAYDTLKDPLKRHNFHNEWCKRKGNVHPYSGYNNEQPKPMVEPSFLDLGILEPNQIKRARFVISNKGGPYMKVLINEPPSWVKITQERSLNNTEKLPLEIELEANPQEWNKQYSTIIKIRVDGIETQINVVLRTPDKQNEQINKNWILSEKKCPTIGCSNQLYFDTELRLYKCRYCKHIFTEGELDSKNQVSSQNKTSNQNNVLKTISFSILILILVVIIVLYLVEAHG